jgi:hypothetical protein
MFLRKLAVEYQDGTGQHPCPLKWLDSFAMRNFTNDPVFDATLPTADGALEAGLRVPLDRLRDDMEDWFRRKGYLPPAAQVTIHEVQTSTMYSRQ